MPCRAGGLWFGVGDANTSLSEGFVYDPLNRLTQTTVNLSTPLVKTFSYSAIGNLLTKSDVGNYGYPSPGSPLPHAVMSLSGGSISTTFTYDPNGNQTAGLGRNIAYSSYNKPASITQGAQTISFLDDTEHQRFQQVTPSGTTLYIAGFGVLAELSNAGTTAAQWTDYLSVGNAKVGMRVLQTASATLSTRYFHTDHLGSISVITDENGNVLERLSYDAWGKRRFPNGSDDPSGSITSQTTRGFTGQEELQVSGLVHLNGRVYDPLLARFTSADPTVTDPLNPQGWNRYSYVGNDPLAFTDPNGFSWLSGFFHSVSHFFSGIVHSITHFLQTNTIARTILQLGLNVLLSPLGPVGAAIAAVVVTGLSGGNLSQILKAGLIAGVTAFGFQTVGDLTPGAGRAFTDDNFNPTAYAENVAGHALVGCASAAASGGKCGAGALSGAIGSAVTPLTATLFPSAGSDLGQRIGGTILEATAGGFASVAGGGKFANGAITAAFGYLDNALPHMLAGTDAHIVLAEYLMGQDRNWSYNTTFLGVFGDNKPDLVYDSMPLNVFEIKPDGSAAAGAIQLATYLDSVDGAQAVAGNNNLIFKGASSLTLTEGGWFGGTYTYTPSGVFAGVVTYTYNQGEVLSTIAGILKQPRTASGGLALPPRLPPVLVP